jgi:hypothetical protein
MVIEESQGGLSKQQCGMYWARTNDPRPVKAVL